MVPDSFLNLGVAALAGLAVGIEREWSGHADGPDARFAGVRTFLVLGLTGGAAGWLATLGYLPLAATLLAGGAALAVAAFVIAARRGPQAIDGTTEAAAVLVLALGALAGTGERVLASGVAAVVVLALMEKQRVHALVQKLGQREFRSALQFAVMSLVVLPLLPSGSYGPLGGVQPRALWTLVLLFSGLDFAGWLARRALGDVKGYDAAGMIGGLVSSTLVSISFARRSREQPELSTALVHGMLGACAVMLLRVVGVTALLNAGVALAALPYLLPPILVAAVYVAVAIVRDRKSASPHFSDLEPDRNPLRLGSAIRMAAGFQLALWLVALVRDRWGEMQMMVSAAVIGATDIDALTVSMSRLGQDPGLVPTAALAIAVGVLASSVVKVIVVLAFGSPAMRRTGGLATLLLTGASIIGIVAAR